MIFSQINEIIKEGSRFAIAAHTSPDGDAIGSTLALYNGLIEIGKKADVFFEENIPLKFSFLPGIQNVKRLENSLDRYDAVFVLDCGDQDRLGSIKKIVSKSNMIVNIDHHISNDLFGSINYVDAKASSVGEIIYQFFKINGYKVSSNTAMCIYTAIITDTGGFKYSNTTSITLSIAGELINTGINFSSINDKVFYERNLTQIKLMSLATSNLELIFNNKVAIMYVTKEMMNMVNAEDGDSSELVNIARDIEGVEVGIFIKEKDEKICRVSLRSKSYVDVRLIAEKFGGGGHIRAAGCTILGDFKFAKDEVIKAVKNYLE